MSLTHQVVDRALGELDAAEAAQIQERRQRPVSEWCWTVLACPQLGCYGKVARLARAGAEHRDAKCPRCGSGGLERIAGPALPRLRVVRPSLIF